MSSRPSSSSSGDVRVRVGNRLRPRRLLFCRIHDGTQHAGYKYGNDGKGCHDGTHGEAHLCSLAEW